MSDEPVDKLSEVLTHLQDMHAEDEQRHSVPDQVQILRQVQEQMKTQLALHDAQIAALHEVIALLGDQSRD